MHKLELNLELIKTNFKKIIWRIIDILKIQGFQIFSFFNLIFHNLSCKYFGHTSNNLRVFFFKRRFLINASSKANIFRFLLKNFLLINFYFSRGAES